MNELILDKFGQLARYYQTIGDGWRARTYYKAIKQLQQLDFEIQSSADIKHLRGIGKSLQQKIDEILATGQLAKIAQEVVPAQEKINVLRDFTNIWGVGPVKARDLYQDGFRTIDELRAKPEVLNSMQKIGLRYYDDLMLKIPRQRIHVYNGAIRLVLNRAFGRDSYDMTIAGSYRRRKKQSGDVDLLITSTNFTLLELVEILQRWGLISDTLSMRKVKFMGIGRCGDNPAFRLDIEFVPLEEWDSTLLYFTGSKENNIRMRNAAIAKGLKLSEHGLFDGDQRLEIDGERGYYEALDLPYLEPWER